MIYDINVEGLGVVITGASRGIGFALAKGFSDCGAHVFNADLKAPEDGMLQETSGQQVTFIKTDITNYVDVERMVRIVNKEKEVHILINNAGIIYKALAENMDFAHWQKVIDVNLTGAMHCTKAFIPYLKKQRNGRIINLCSMQSFLGTPTYGAYTAAKAALSSLTRVWANELAEHGVTVNAICPSFVDTPMLKSAMEKFAELHGITFEEAYKKFIELVPQKRVLKVEEIVFVALFLASPLSQSLTGQNLLTAGGMVMN